MIWPLSDSVGPLMAFVIIMVLRMGERSVATKPTVAERLVVVHGIVFTWWAGKGII